MKKLFLLIAILLTLTGCVSYKELNDIGIITAIGIDYSNNKYILTFSMLTPSEENKEKRTIYKTEDANIETCFNNIYNVSTKKAYLAHTDLLILSNNIKKENYDDIFNLFLNRPDSRNSFNVIILENYNKDIFKINTDEINNLLKVSNEESSLIKPITLDEVIKNVLELNISYIPVLKDNKKLELIGYKSIYEDNNKLTSKESLALNFIRNDINQTLITVDNTSYQVNTSNTTLSINKNNIDINIISELTLLDEKQNNNKDINNYKDYIKQIINEFLTSQNLNYFYNKIYKYDYNYAKNHENYDINFTINVEVSINKNTNIKGGNPFAKK